MPLLTLSPSRIALEVRRAELNAAADRDWRHHLTITLVHAGAWYFLGVFLLLASFHATGPRAQVLMLVGWFVGNVAPITVLVAYWLREQA
jgi:hypothetical protein